MPRLEPNQMATVRKYVAARYSHLERAELKQVRKRTLRQLKKADPDRRARFVREAEQLLERSGLA